MRGTLRQLQRGTIMAKTIDQNESIRIAHLAMTQGIITRMGANSFALKALSATISSAAVAISATADNLSLVYVLVAIVPIVFFWFLDAQYLRYERAYIKLYNCVRKGESIEMYSLKVKPFLKKVDSVFCIGLSWSIGPFYLILLIIISSIGLIALFKSGGLDVIFKCAL